MGLFDSLKGALESEAMPALINAVLEKTQYHESMAWSPLWKRAVSGRRSSHGLATAKHADHRGSVESGPR